MIPTDHHGDALTHSVLSVRGEVPEAWVFVLSSDLGIGTLAIFVCLLTHACSWGCGDAVGGGVGLAVGGTRTPWPPRFSFARGCPPASFVVGFPCLNPTPGPL